jgi:hypothetical protein
MFVSYRTIALPQTEFMQSGVIEFLQTGKFERLPGAA